MKYILPFVLLILISCQTDSPVSEEEQKAFERMAQDYQSAYMEGSKNCDKILGRMDREIRMWENGSIWSYADLEKFCPHLPSKPVIQTYNKQVLLGHDLGYDYVSQLYLRRRGDTMRETTSRIWKKVGDEWKIVEMNSMLNLEIN